MSPFVIGVAGFSVLLFIAAVLGFMVPRYALR